MYLTWLNNAYAMEIDLTKTLEAQLDDFEDYPEALRGVQEHLEVTKRHAEHVKSCIERLGGDASVIKSGLANMMGMMKGASMEVMHDKVVKNMLADYAAEHLEISSYKALIETAKEVDDTEGVRVFEKILKDEEEMAQTIEKQLPKILKQFLATHDE